MLKVIAKLKKMAITMPDDDNPFGTITGTFTCQGTEDNMIQLHQMAGYDILLSEVQPTLFSDHLEQERPSGEE